MPLFGQFADKGAAQAECERLSTIPRAELAATVMGVFAPGEPGAKNPGRGINILQVMLWLMSSHPHGTSFFAQLQMPVREALQLLENASLVINLDSRISGTHFTATTLGQEALTEGAVALYLPH